MPTLFLAFANSDKTPLNSLRIEDSKVNSTLNDRKRLGDFIVHSEQYATNENIISGLRTFQNDIVLFLYSGHAGRDKLKLEDGDANADGIAALLGRCPNLKLVVLNGCSTLGQVDALLKNNVPIVIATSAPVNDERATQFSITFFEELASKRQSIRLAFDAAIAAAKVKGRIDFEIRARGIMRIPIDTHASLWGIYHQDNQADELDIWRLPEKPLVDKSNTYITNAIEGIYENYEEVLKSQGEESRGQDVILKRLPYSISEPIRKLLAPSDNSGQLFYDRPSNERFQMLLYAYRSIMAFATYVSMAQLWERKRQLDTVKEDETEEERQNREAERQLLQNALDTEGVRDMLKKWLNSDFQNDNKRSLLPLLRQLAAFLSKNKIPHFLKELDGVLAEWQNAENHESVDFLEKQVADNPQRNLEYLCDETEQHLAVVLYQFGFLIHYGLTSVKDINVLFYQHSTEPDFEHKIVKLQQALTNLEDRTESEKNYHKTATILLRRVDDKSKFLYLSPFFIDENAYTKSPKAKLCFFVAYDASNKRFHFRHVSKPDNIIKIEKKKVSIMAKIKGDTDQNDNYFPLINGQFSAFCKDMFGKTLEEL
ncbi:MAG: hypothetical protein JNL70_21025 [Saprospiraceae bacterium]|nr:hypothetical protein [Saprospiraceae bacterium]